ncbi:unnamed protein product [Closterium sp. NIES-53]
MASLSVLVFDHEGRPIQFDTWLDDLQLYLLSNSRDSISLFDHTSGASLAPPATADSATRSQWLSCDAAARLAVRNHLPLAERAHFGFSSCEAEIYAGAMAAQELRWLTYLLTYLGEPPRSSLVLTKHIALPYFLAQELQQRGQLRLVYVATRANTADIFTKALPPGDHQRFCTVLGLVPTLPHLLTA